MCKVTFTEFMTEKSKEGYTLPEISKMWEERKRGKDHE